MMFLSFSLFPPLKKSIHSLEFQYNDKYEYYMCHRMDAISLKGIKIKLIIIVGLLKLNISGFSFTLPGKDQRMFQDLPGNLFEAPSSSKMETLSST